MKSQVELFYQEARRIGEKHRFFMDMIKDPVNPLTNDDLSKMIKRWPERYSCYSGFLGKLKN